MFFRVHERIDRAVVKENRRVVFVDERVGGIGGVGFRFFRALAAKPVGERAGVFTNRAKIGRRTAGHGGHDFCADTLRIIRLAQAGGGQHRDEVAARRKSNRRHRPAARTSHEGDGCIQVVMGLRQVMLWEETIT